MSDFVFDLEHGSWPVLLVDEAGAIRRNNAAARATFAAKLSQQSLGPIWAAENPTRFPQFLAQVTKGIGASVPLKFVTPSAPAVSYLVVATHATGAGEKLILLQLLPSLLANGAAEARPQSVEINLAQKQKLDCALQLARTVALDFNNALTTILGHVSHLLACAEADHPWRLSLVEAERAATRAAEIASQLAAFSSEEKDSRSRAPGNLNHLLRRTAELFQTPQNAAIAWSLQLENKLFAAKYDEAKIQQAIVKILENAVQAMKNGGRIVVRTRNLELADSTQDRTAQLRPGAYVCLEITDDGCGIEPASLSRVFEPFFTTKYGHRGLGLAWVYGIVTNHGGGVAISSQLGHGTSVRLYLPAVKKLIEEKLVSDGLEGARQTVLVVDDEEMVLTMASMILSAHGYRVLTAPSGDRALEAFAQTSALIDLLITDMVMPGMNGRELMDKVRLLSPATRMVCSTGCAPAGTHELDFLPKPFTAQQLLRKVKEALTS